MTTTPPAVAHEPLDAVSVAGALVDAIEGPQGELGWVEARITSAANGVATVSIECGSYDESIAAQAVSRFLISIERVSEDDE